MKGEVELRGNSQRGLSFSKTLPEAFAKAGAVSSLKVVGEKSWLRGEARGAPAMRAPTILCRDSTATAQDGPDEERIKRPHPRGPRREGRDPHGVYIGIEGGVLPGNSRVEGFVPHGGGNPYQTRGGSLGFCTISPAANTLRLIQ